MRLQSSFSFSCSCPGHEDGLGVGLCRRSGPPRSRVASVVMGVSALVLVQAEALQLLDRPPYYARGCPPNLCSRANSSADILYDMFFMLVLSALDSRLRSSAEPWKPGIEWQLRAHKFSINVQNIPLRLG